MRFNSKYLIEPFQVTSYRPVAYLVLLMLLCSVLALLYAPVLMPASYHWLAHTTSESGAQGLEGAWLARLGFFLYGFAVLLLALALRHHWGRAAFVMHAAFGVCMIGNAAFSSRSWLAGLPFDAMEDLLHSLMSNMVGTAFSLGVLAVLFQRRKTERLAIAFDLAAIATAIFISLAMLHWSGIDGLIQRIMFAVAYVWYAKEALAIVRGLPGSL